MILGYAVFGTMLYDVYIILTSILQSLNKFKLVYTVALTGFTLAIELVTVASTAAPS